MAHNLPIQAPLEVDEGGLNDAESLDNQSIGSASYISSISSSIRNYKYENGRRYHAFHEGAYMVPNDEEEQDRMDLLHHIYRLLLKGELYFAPIAQDVHRVLDIGTGTGIWAIQFAEEHPSAEVIGTDLSPIQPPWIPPNCTFEVDDFDTEWIYHRPFDFIHGRELEGCTGDEEKLFRQAFRHLKPGGYFEFDGCFPFSLSDDGTHEKAENFILWTKEMRAAANKFGKTLDDVSKWKEKMEKAGFIDVTEFVAKLPLRPWAKDPHLKEIGKYQQLQQIQTVDSYTPAFFSRILGWSEMEIQVLTAKIRKELLDTSIHAYLSVNFVYGRKPPG